MNIGSNTAKFCTPLVCTECMCVGLVCPVLARAGAPRVARICVETPWSARADDVCLVSEWQKQQAISTFVITEA